MTAASNAVLTRLQMRAAENAAMANGDTVHDLMDRAGTGAARAIARVALDREIVILTGGGNNGGDGYVAAQALRRQGFSVRVAAARAPGSEAAIRAAALWDGLTESAFEAAAAPVFVDCLFGTGLNRPLDPGDAALLDRFSAGAKARIAMDVPSGVDADSGELLHQFPQYDVTCALGGWKWAHWIEPARGLCGNLLKIDIGVDAASSARVIERPLLRRPAPAAHKYTRGLVAVVAGEMAGAANLAADAAHYSGAGYVKLFAPPGHSVAAESIIVDNYTNADELSDQLGDPRIGAVVIGPGLGRQSDRLALLKAAISNAATLLVDADALTLDGAAQLLAERDRPTVITPHAGEFAALSGDEDGTKWQAARALAQKLDVVVLLKGSDTIVAHPDGRLGVAGRTCSWLSTAGSGDILSGVVAAQLAGGVDPFAAGCAAQWLHTRAGELAGPAFAPKTMVRCLPKAITECL